MVTKQNKQTKQNQRKRRIIIAGPCGMESEEVMMSSIEQIKKRPDIDFMRFNLWKPRTKPGFEGLGKDGTNLLKKAVKLGINPGVEVLTADHARHIIDSVFSVKNDVKLLLWIGARNQNHLIQREIAKVCADDNRITLMAKNQPWFSKSHWEGIIEHILSAGMPKDRLMVCHRGFTPYIPYTPNPHNYRNIPEHKTAIEIKTAYDLPMIFDPSHTGGSIENVYRIMREASLFDYDGWIIEVHPHRETAKSDSKQQLHWHEFDEVIGRTI